MIIVAFDLSLTRSGWAMQESHGVIVPPRGHDRGMRRIAWIRDRVLQHADGADLVVLEGYSYGSKGSAVINLGELGGVVRLALFERRIPYVEVAPGTLKRYATGKGNAGKEEVLAAAIRRLDFTGHDNNAADALWLWQMATDAYGLVAAAVVPAAHRAALQSVEWPALAAEVAS